MFDIKKMVNETQKGKNRTVKHIIKYLKKEIKIAAYNGRTSIEADIFEEDNPKAVMSYFVNKGFICFSHKSGRYICLTISWEYYEKEND